MTASHAPDRKAIGLAGHPRLRAARDIDAFLRDPLGHYVMRRTFSFWQRADGVNGVVAWGVPNREDVVEMSQVFDVALVCPAVGRHVSIVDTRAITGIDPPAFESLLEHLSSRREAWAAHVERQAVIVERAVFGAALAGLFELLAPYYPARSFVDPGEALTWLSPRDPDGTRQTFETMRTLALDVPEPLRRLRALFESEQRVFPLEEAATRLEMTMRTLQRHLLAAETSMREEARAFRLRSSAELLETTEMPVSAVARAVGVTDAQLGKLYRAAHGVSPIQFRARQRRTRRE